jgi:WD40 repeat protein
VALRTRQYEAFISYSHAGDSVFAAELQRILNRIARPIYKWWQWWPPRVFRDQTNLVAAPDLGAEIENALASSDSFVLLASAQAAASPWVDREVRTWCAGKPSDRLFIALTSGAIAWDDAHGDFDGSQTNAIPPGLRHVFDAEPLWVDFTGVQPDEGLARNPRFVDGAATLAAAIRGTDKDAIVGEDVRQRRRTKQLVGGAIGLLTLLTVLAGIAAIYALIQRNHADERARLATSRQLAAEAVVALDNDPEQSLALAARAATTAPTSEAADALRQALRNSRLRSIIVAGRPVRNAAIDPKGRLVAAALGDGSIHTWTLRTGKPLLTRRLAAFPFETVQFSPDCKRLLGTSSKAGVAVWSTAESSRRPLATFDKEGEPLTAAFSPNRRLVATGEFDGRVRLWRSDTGVLVDDLRPTEHLPVTAISFSAERSRSRLAAARGARVTVWTLPTRRARMFPSRQRVQAVALSPDGAYVATGDTGGLARVWNVGGGGRVDLNGHSGQINSIAFSRDGKTLVTASDDETARIWDARTGRSLAELRGHDGIVNSAAFAPDGKTVVTGGKDGTIRIWSTTSDPSRELTRLNELRVHDVAFDRSGERIVTASEDRTARIWSLARGRVLHVLGRGRRAYEWVESAQFSRDGRLVVTAVDDGTAKVWDASSAAHLATLGQPEGTAILDAAISPDGQLVAAAGQAGADRAVVRLWRWRQRKLVMARGGFADQADGVAFSPSGSLLAAAAQDEVRVWRAGDGSLVARLHGRGELTSVAFDPGGELLVAGADSGAAWLWDLRSKKRVALLNGHSDTVTAVAFSANARYLVTSSHDGLAKVWTVPGGDLVTTLRSRSELESASFAPRGRRLAVAGAGGRVTLFDCVECRPLGSLVCLAASRVTPEVRAREEDVFARCD